MNRVGVIGAGAWGTALAQVCARAGREVVVLDPGPPGGGMTSRTTGHLVTALDGRWFSLIARRGLKKAKLAAQSHAGAVDFIHKPINPVLVRARVRLQLAAALAQPRRFATPASGVGHNAR